MAAKVIGTPSILNTPETIEKDDITVGNPSDWLILPIGQSRGNATPLRVVRFLYTNVFSLGWGYAWPSLILRWP